MLKQFTAISLLFNLVALSLPSGPSLSNIDSWLPINYEKGEHSSLPPVSGSWKDANTEIFVGISHYRDMRCSVTLKNLFSKAKYPDRIKIGVAQQIHTEKDEFDCIKDYCKMFAGKACPHRSQISIIEFTHQDSRGPTYARYQQQSLIQNEEFCMQTDAHSDFIQDWDLALTTMWGSINSEYAVLSSAAPDVSVLKNSDLNGHDQQVPHLCQATFDSRGMVVNLPPVAAVHLTSPILSPLYSSGFSFSKCHAELKAPPDPNLQVVFEVDDFTKFARLWTRGYDVYTPNKIVVAHDYEHSLGSHPGSEPLDPMRWVQNGMTPEFARLLYDNSIKRVGSLLGFPEAERDLTALSVLTSYGLGNKRSLDQLIEFTGIDTRSKTVFADRCMELSWVPFEADPDPYTLSGDVWGGAPEMMAKGGPNVPLVASGTVELLPASLFTETVTSIQRRRAAALDGDALGAVLESKQHLRTGANVGIASKGGRIEQVEEEVVLAFQHRGKELWWIFQSVDTAVEALMNHIDAEVGMGHGHRVVKLILLVTPVFLLVLGGAIWVMIGGSSARDMKRI